MNKFKSVLSIILAIGMVIGMTACAPAKEDDSNVTSKIESVAPESKEEVAVDDPYTKYAAKDLGGRIIKIAFNYDIVPANSDYVFNPETDTEDVKHALEAMKRVEEKYNCKIQYVNLPYDQRTEQIISTVMSGAPVADILSLDIQQMLSLVPKDMLLAYEDFAPADADIFSKKEILIPEGKLFGKTYVVNQRALPTNGDFLGVNMTLVESLGLGFNPVELYEKGEWTWDKFNEIIKAATADTDGDGKTDQFGVSGHPHVLFNLLLASNGGSYFDPDSHKQELDSPATMEAFNLLNQIYNVDKGAMIVDSITAWDPNLNAFKEGKSAMFPLSTWMIPDGENAVSFDLTILPTPKGPSNKGTSSFMKLMSGMAVLKNIEDPGVIYQIYEEMLIPYNNDYEASQEANMEYLQTKFKKQADIDRLFKICTEGPKYDASSGVPEFPAGDIVMNIVDKGKTPAQAVEASKQIAQDKIDSVFGDK